MCRITGSASFRDRENLFRNSVPRGHHLQELMVPEICDASLGLQPRSLPGLHAFGNNLTRSCLKCPSETPNPAENP